MQELTAEALKNYVNIRGNVHNRQHNSVGSKADVQRQMSTKSQLCVCLEQRVLQYQQYQRWHRLPESEGTNAT